jgi:tetratricopeptide (TPR) repeat protein
VKLHLSDVRVAELKIVNSDEGCVSRLLEILGRGLNLDVADLIWSWLEVTGPAGPADKSALPEQLKNVIEFIRERKIDSASDQLRLYLFDNPDCPRGRLASAAIFISMGRLQDAIEQLNSVYLRQPNNTMALYALGHCYERLGKQPQAVEFYQDCLKFKNYLQLPRQRLAAVYFENNQLEKAAVEFELLKSEYPDDIWTLVTLGHLYLATARYEHAAQTFNTAVLIHPDNFCADDTHNIDQLVHDGLLYQAAEQLEYQLAEQPDRADLLLRYADILAMLGNAEQAVFQYQKLISLRPDCLEATVKLGTQFLHIHDESSAAHQFNRAVEINDCIAEVYIGLAAAKKSLGDTSGAVATLLLGSALEANSAFLFTQTAILQFKHTFEDPLNPLDLCHSSHLIKTVIAAHRQQIANQPQNPNLHYRLGLLLMSLSSFPEAIEAFRSALEINPTYFRACTKLAVCLLEAGDHKSALEQLTVANTLDTDTIKLHYKFALLYCDALRFASSLINLQQYMQDNFAGTYNVPNVAVVLENLGLLDRAAAMWDNLSETAGHTVSNRSNQQTP